MLWIHRLSVSLKIILNHIKNYSCAPKHIYQAPILGMLDKCLNDIKLTGSGFVIKHEYQQQCSRQTLHEYCCSLGNSRMHIDLAAEFASTCKHLPFSLKLVWHMYGIIILVCMELFWCMNNGSGENLILPWQKWQNMGALKKFHFIFKKCILLLQHCKDRMEPGRNICFHFSLGSRFSL